jgi:hypothetical protein
MGDAAREARIRRLVIMLCTLAAVGLAFGSVARGAVM